MLWLRSQFVVVADFEASDGVDGKVLSLVRRLDLENNLRENCQEATISIRGSAGKYSRDVWKKNGILTIVKTRPGVMEQCFTSPKSTAASLLLRLAVVDAADSRSSRL